MCPAGSHCPNTTTPPIPCLDGYYSLDCATECIPCPPGHYCPLTDSLPIVCDVGTYSTGRAMSCLSCEPGYACPEGTALGNASAHLCSLGKYCPDGGMELDCPAGTYGSALGLVNISECILCPPGYYCPDGTAGYPRAELQCPLGHYCPNGTATQFEHPCPNGYYSTVFGLERSDQCLVCKAGRYCNGGDGVGGQICPNGHFCPEMSGDPSPCPNGTYTEATGSEDLTYCKSCPAGYFCPEGTDTPIHCPAGTFNPLLGQDSQDDCQSCKAGRACTMTALTQPDVLCASGHYCPEGSDKAADPDHECPAGTFTDFHNLTDPSECSMCPPGEACLSGTGGVQRSRLPCAPGHFCPNGTEFPTQYSCAAGSYSNATNLQRQQECILCPAGEFCSGGQTAPSGPCDRGHYCIDGKSSSERVRT